MYNKRLIFWSACIGMLLFGITMITLGSIIPDVRNKLGLDEVSAGLLFSILPFGILAGSLLFGPIADRNGYRLLLSVSCLILFLGFEGLAISRTMPMLTTCVFLIGLGGGSINGATNALVSDISDTGKGANLNLLGVFYGIGALGMPLFTGILRDVITINEIISAAGLLCLAVAIFYLMLRFPPPKLNKGHSFTMNLHLLADNVLILISVFLFFQSSFEGIMTNWTTSFLIYKLDIQPGKAMLALSLFVTGMAAMRILTGGFLRKVSEKSMLIYCFILIFSGLILLSLSKTFFISVTGLFILGAGLSYGFPVMLGFVGARFAELSGTAFSIALVIALVGNMSVNYGMGLIAKAYGINHLTTVAFSELLIMVLLSTVIFRKLTK